MKNKTYDLTSKVRLQSKKQLAGIIETRKEGEFAYVYGSFSEGLPFHDIDIGIYTSGVKKEDATFYALDISRLIEAEVHMPVDVRVLNYAPVSFLYHVIRGELIFERDEDMRVDFVENTVRRYLDIKPLIRRGIKEAFAA
ncbi:MAG: nucleotidyltransferase domain-containing protein [Candidatus Brocadiales bacterium]|nr:nucleotidyltransferase domain-containing protein [Candidatus Brocadiales bacterium]